MKLKPNGLVKILEQIPQPMPIKDAIKIEKIEFEPSDFKGAIILTVKEAEDISLHLYRLAQLYEMQILELDSDKKLIKPLAKTYEGLNEKIVQAMKLTRIKQAEVKE